MTPREANNTRRRKSKGDAGQEKKKEVLLTSGGISGESRKYREKARRLIVSKGQRTSACT